VKRGCEKTKVKSRRGLDDESRIYLNYLNPSSIPDLADEASGACVSFVSGIMASLKLALWDLCLPLDRHISMPMLQNPMLRKAACDWVDGELMEKKWTDQN
jgi:hypothetical protein